MKITIKHFSKLTAEELYDILRLRTDIFIVEQACVYADCDGKDKFAHHLYIEDGGEIVAYCRILDKGVNFDEVSLGRFAVRINRRGSGIAKIMLKAAMEFIKDKLDAPAVKLSSQSYISGLYANYGFQPISEPYADDNIVHVDMAYYFK